jgi:1,4-alpha-glucan branching enzyme
LTPFDLHLHAEGTHHESYRMLGAHLVREGDARGVRFALWAPNADDVSVIGDFNQWNRANHPMQRRDGGVWELFIPLLGVGTHYK